MELILHTADINKDALSLEKALCSDVDTVELDFVMTKDAIPVWTHNLFPTSLYKFHSQKNQDMLTLFEVLDINNHRKKLMLDIKYIPGYIMQSEDFKKLFNYLNSYDEMQIQSLDLNLIKNLKSLNYSNFEIGFIINVLSKGFVNKFQNLPNIDFMAISSELWEKNSGSYVSKCNSLYPNVKKYAWTWSTRDETEKRIINFINNNADGIITSDPSFVRSLINKKR